MNDSPMTDDGFDWDDPDTVCEVLFFRVGASDDEWANDPASEEWDDLTQDEAQRRIDAEDYSNPFF